MRAASVNMFLSTTMFWSNLSPFLLYEEAIPTTMSILLEAGFPFPPKPDANDPSLSFPNIILEFIPFNLSRPTGRTVSASAF